MLKLASCAIALLIFLATLRYAASHVYSPVAPLHPPRADATLNGPSATPHGGLAFPFIAPATAVPTTTQAPITRTRQS